MNSLSPTFKFAGPSDHSSAALSTHDEVDRFVVKLICIELSIVVLTQIFAIPIGSDNRDQVSFALLLHFAFVAVLGIHHRVKIDLIRMMLFLIMSAIGLAVHVRLVPGTYSLPSMFYTIVTYSCYIFIVPVNINSYKKICNFFTILGIVAGLLTWFDWLTQLLHLGMIDFYNSIPKILQYHSYNYLKRFWFGPIKIQPNGIFFLESSILSQFMAMALVFEIVMFGRIKRMLFLIASIVASFGGTGMSILLLTSPFLIVRINKKIIMAGVVGAPIIILLAFQLGLVDNIARRSTEGSGRSSSTNIRFVMPVVAVHDAAVGPFDDFLLVRGAEPCPRASMLPMLMLGRLIRRRLSRKVSYSSFSGFP